MALYRDGKTVKEVTVIKHKGGTLDYTYYGDKLYTLRPTYGLNFSNLLKGKKVFKSKLLVYSLKGK